MYTLCKLPASLLYLSLTFGLPVCSYLNKLNFNATFGDSPAPFTIDVDPAFINYTKLKASHTRYVEDIDEPAFSEGPTHQNVSTVRDFWVDEYDWFQVQDQLNKK